MKKTIFLALALLTLAAQAQQSQVARPRTNNQYVNVFIGTNGMGHCFPGACYPYGSVQLSPDTDTIPHNVNGKYQPQVYDYCAGYQYRDNTIVGFSHTHFSGTGHSDLGDILIMPYTGETKLNPGTKDNPDGGYRQRFSHSTETARPGYYAVTLADDNIQCELTATEHCGVHRYTYPKGAKQRFVLDLNHGIYNYDGKTLWAQCNKLDWGPVREKISKDIAGYIITGYRITNGWSRTNYTYFAILVNKRITNWGCHDFAKSDYQGGWAKFDTEHKFPEMGGKKLVCWFEAEQEDDNPQLELVVALSATSVDDALNNLRHDLFADAADCIPREADHKTFCTFFPFDCMLQHTEEAWTQRLSTFQCQGTEDQKTMFYTSLYHTLIHPSLYCNADGTYRGVDGDKHYSPRKNYTVFSLWDTYRAFHPLLTLIDTTLVGDVVASMVNHCQQSPHRMLPVWSHMGCENWCMTGYHGVSVVMDAYYKNIIAGSNNDYFEAMIAADLTSNTPYYGNTDVYLKKGYIPVELNPYGTSTTLENAYEDWCISQCPEIIQENDDHLQRAYYYRNVFDTTIGFVRGRHADGSWQTPYSLLSTNGQGLIEGNSWNYSFYVPHDVNGMMQLMGGSKAFEAKLDTLFTMHVPDEFFAATEDVTREGMLGGYVHGNEPSHHIPYLYMWTTHPYKTQYWIREIMNKMYRNHIDGLCGNDDCGQMSAWYIFSAMGFYPVCPGSNQYVIGAPYMPYMKVTLANGKTLEIKAPKVSDKNRYIRQVKWNGQVHTNGYLTHEQLMQGGVLEFDMTSRPTKGLFTGKDHTPYSLTK